MDRRSHGFLGGLLVGLVGVGILVISAIALLLAPIVVWVAWNVLDFGKAIGAGDLGFWGIILLSIFLVGGAFIRIVVVSLVFLIDPAWFSAAGTLMWPEPTFKIWVATLLLILVASHSAAATRRRSEHRGGEPSSYA
ncbi:MAG TPA: hypothetical protein VH391_04890 [Solirubrobacterales bacterium]